GRLATERAAVGESGDLGAARGELAQVQAALAEIGLTKQRLDEVKREGETLRKRFDELDAAARGHDRLLEQRASLQAEPVDELRSEHLDLVQKRIHVAAALEYSEVARRTLADRSCPLLDLVCPVV